MVFFLMLVLSLHGQEPASHIFRNGRIYTMDAGNRIVEAVATRGNRILAAGSATQIDRLRRPETKITDLQGKIMLPGFYAAHDHFPAWSRTALFEVDLNSPPIGMRNTIEDYVVALRAKAAQTPKGQWVLGRGYDDTLIRDKRHPTRSDLDRVSTEHPVWIVHISGHLGVGNSKALAMAGITKNTAQPRGGRIQKDAGGDPNGVIEESLSMVSRLIPVYTAEQRQQLIRRADEEYWRRGVTTAVVAGGNRQQIEDLNAASTKGALHVRMVHMIGAAAAPASPAEAATWTPQPARVRTAAIKITQDGSLQGYTGYLTAPYHHQPDDNRGYPARPRQALVDMVKKFHRAGFQIAIHGNGDAAIDDILHAYREAQREFPRADPRHRIEHCQTPREDQLDAMKDLGVTPSFFNGHVYYWGDRHRDIFLGPQRAARISPLKSAMDRGIRFTLHNDTPVTPVNPLLLVQTAVTRMTRGGSVLGPDQRIPLMQALRAVTIDAAWQNFEEKERGSIEPGKFADLIILNGKEFDPGQSITIVQP